MDAITFRLIIALILSILANNAVPQEPRPQGSFEFTSKEWSVDELLFSEDLFPGHTIPHNLHHNEALRIFNDLLDNLNLLSEAYKKFRAQYLKDPEDLKYEIRKAHFKEHLHMIFNHNLKADGGHYQFQLGVNMFADMSKDEMKQFLGYNTDKLTTHLGNFGSPAGPPNHQQNPPHPGASGPSVSPNSTSTPFPHSFDLRDDNVISPIKNQKKCGSCVFFSMGALMETLHAIKNNGEIINVSEQMMLDCATPENGYTNNEGCDGNIMEDTAQFLVDHGVTQEGYYKYVANQTSCDMSGKEIVAKLKEYWQVDPTVEGFKNTLVNERSPIAAAFLVYPTFMFYRTGVFDQCIPPGGNIGGHAVMVTGYGHFFDTGYWVVKNSWGRSWGESGYFKYVSGSSFCKFERWGFSGILE